MAIHFSLDFAAQALNIQLQMVFFLPLENKQASLHSEHVLTEIVLQISAQFLIAFHKRLLKYLIKTVFKHLSCQCIQDVLNLASS